ncbi:MAG: DUF3842 family protein [Clostridium fessum]
MKKVVIIDGQGGRMGRALVEEIHKLCPEQPLLALGANTTATAAMMKAGAAMGATGENPVLVACRDADLIIGPIGIVIADSLLGEITPAMAAAIGQSRAQKILIPVSGSSYCRHILVGTQNLPMNEYIHLAAEEAAAYLNIFKKCTKLNSHRSAPCIFSRLFILQNLHLQLIHPGKFHLRPHKI